MEYGAPSSGERGRGHTQQDAVAPKKSRGRCQSLSPPCVESMGSHPARWTWAHRGPLSTPRGERNKERAQAWQAHASQCGP